MATTTKTGYCNGSDMLLYVAGKAVGHCTTHTVTMNSETKDRAVKPAASAAMSAGLWKGKGVTGLSISISAEALVFYGEAETGYKPLFKAWQEGKSVDVKCMERENSDKPYLSGKFIIASLERTDPARMTRPTASHSRTTACPTLSTSLQSPKTRHLHPDEKDRDNNQRQSIPLWADHGGYAPLQAGNRTRNNRDRRIKFL